MTTIIGIDPGRTGAIARTDGEHHDVIDLPHVADVPDVRAIIEFIEAVNGADLIIVERQQAMPKQGVASTFQTGVGFGSLMAACYVSTVPFRVVRASEWKKKLGLVGKDKEASRALAIQLFPSMAGELKRVKDHGRAEALLLAYYGRMLI